MRVILVLPANTLYSPYRMYYEDILNEMNVDFQYIIWDRLHKEYNRSYIIYRDKKKKFKRNLTDYIKFINFVKSKLRILSFDKLILFTLPIGKLMESEINKFYKKKYILDIRDYHRIAKLGISKLIKNSFLTVISSNGFLKWLPSQEGYVLSNNLRFKISDEIVPKIYDYPIKVSYIGTIRNVKINEELISKINKSSKIQLSYHGASSHEKRLKSLESSHVIFTGEYTQEHENVLYRNSDFINILSQVSLNEDTLIPNRLYKAVEYAKPVIVFDGTHLSNIVRDFNLGIILNRNFSLDQLIMKLSDFDYSKYTEGRKLFIEKINLQIDAFQKKVGDFFD